MEKFEKLGLSNEIIEILRKKGFTEPTEIQEKAIPLVLAGKDIIGGSATGSGKTLAFSSQIIESLSHKGHVQALVLTPTRELAEQVSDAIKFFSSYKKLKTTAVYGGVSISSQIRKLETADIVVGTPGRILDHLGRRTLNLNKSNILVLDEVDRMFDMGFQDDVEKIISQCPTKRQTMLFSATISGGIDHLAKKHTSEAKEISVASQVDPAKLKQIFYDVQDGLKFSLLVHLLNEEKSNLVMVFCNTRRNVDFVTKNLNAQNIKAKAIHGGMLQNKRKRVLEDFHNNELFVLVCTDVAARGLDIKNVTHVYNYDLPKLADDYIHRIGRTARAGEEGKAIIILSSRDYENFNIIQERTTLNISKEETPYIKRVELKLGDDRGFRNKGFSRGNQNRNNGSRRFGGRNQRDNDSRGRFGNGNQGGFRKKFGDRNNKFGNGNKRFGNDERSDDSRGRFGNGNQGGFKKKFEGGNNRFGNGNKRFGKDEEGDRPVRRFRNNNQRFGKDSRSDDSKKKFNSRNKSGFKKRSYSR